MNLTQLLYFNNLAQSQHYASTAEQLGVAQSSLSRSISALEEELGVFLFEKQGRNIRLTKYGEAFHRYVRDALGTLEAGEKYVKDMADPYCGEINLGLIYSLGPKIMPDMIRRFTAHPENQRFRIRLSQAATSDLVQMLKEGQCDLILCSPPEIPDPDLELVEILPRKFIALVSVRHPLSVRDHISLEELSQYPLVVSTEQLSSLRRIFLNRGLPLNILSEIQGECAAAGLVDVNYGVAILNTSVNYTGLAVKALTIDELEDYNFPLYLANYKNRWLSPAVLSFRKFLLEEKIPWDWA